jgi:hypothetical protein
MAPAKVLQGAVRLHGLASLPTPDTHVRVACADAVAWTRHKPRAASIRRSDLLELRNMCNLFAVMEIGLTRYQAPAGQRYSDIYRFVGKKIGAEHYAHARPPKLQATDGGDSAQERPVNDAGCDFL